jgi:hypothetical protein
MSAANVLIKKARINIAFESKKTESIWSDLRNLRLVVIMNKENKVNCNAVMKAINEVIVSIFI